MREDDLATEAVISVEELRKWRRKNLVENDHYQKNPIRYTPDGIKRVLEAFKSPSVDSETLAEILELAAPDTQTVRPIVERIPPNQRLVICQVGEHHNVRVMVRPNNYNYLLKMEIPMDVSMINFNPSELLIFNGDPPRRRGQW